MRVESFPRPRRARRPFPTGGPAIKPLDAALQDHELAPPGERPLAHPLTLVHGDGHAGRGFSAGALLRACRPRQWAKNVLVLAAPAAAGLLDRPGIAARALGAFVVMCLVSSATYLINDVRDREQDRMHPRKRLRPIAAGEITPRAAVRIAAALALAGLALAAAIAPSLAGVALLYMLITSSYSVWWRHVVVLDIVMIAAGFVLRAIAGGAATDIYLSRWFVLVTAFCAIFLVAAKRLAELRDHSGVGPARATLSSYSLGSLRLTLATSASAAGVAYVSWAVTRPAHLAWYVLSALPFIAWLGRYSVLIAAGAGQAPEELILRDRILLALSAAWALLFLVGVYAGR